MSAGYGGPVVDAFLHTPWFGGDDPDDPRGDRVDWTGDPRLRRVMHTFHHTSPDGAHAEPLGQEHLLADMEAAGVERAILPAKVYYAASEQGVRAVHRELAKLTDGTGGRIRAVGTIVPPELGPGSYWDVMQNGRLLAEATERHGFVGVHVTPSPWGMPPSHKWFYPLYAKCVELGVALFSYVGMPGPLWPMAPNDPAHLDEVALAFPELRIVAHHIGDPWVDMAIRLAARHPHVYLCTSAWSPKRYPPALVAFMRETWHGTPGSRKVVYASDAPLLDMRRATRDARALGLAEDQLRAVLHDNARRLFWPDEEEATG